MVDTSGNVWGTGFNANGELGLGNTTNQTLFTKSTALNNITDLGISGDPGYAYAQAGSSITKTPKTSPGKKSITSEKKK